MGGVAAPFCTGVQCVGTIEDNQAPHPTEQSNNRYKTKLEWKGNLRRKGKW